MERTLIAGRGHAGLAAGLLALLALSACTIKVDTATVLTAEPAAQPLDIAALDPGRSAENSGARLEPIEIRHADGLVGHGIHLIRPASKIVIVYLAGNKMPLRDRAPILLPRFAALNADLLWMDYRGAGASPGQPTVETLQSDAQDLLNLAAQLHKKIVVHGLSMGSALAAGLSSDPRVAGLVLEGALTSMAQVADATMPFWIKPFVTVDIEPKLAAINTIPAVARFDRPLLVIVGQNDDETPPVLSHRLYDAAKSAQKSFLEVPAAKHADSLTFSVTVDAYREFLEKL